MKYNRIVILGMLLAFASESAAVHIRNTNRSHGIKNSDEKEQAENEDLDSLMDKYDKNEEKAKTKKVEKKTGTKEPTAAEVQEEELKILQGNNFAESS